MAAVVALAALVVAGTGCSSGGGGAAPAPSHPPCAQVPVEAQRAEGIQTIHAFAGPDGANPLGSVYWKIDGWLYGTTSAGGPEGAGVLFAVRAREPGYEVLVPFAAGPDAPGGNHPRHDAPDAYDGALTYNTAGGGEGEGGVTASFDQATGTERVVHAYAGGPGDGAHPSGGIEATVDGLWVLTPEGGAHDRGALVRIDPATGASEVAHSFAGADGAEPHGRVTVGGDDRLYGMTSRGGASDAGVLFAYDPATRGFQVLHELGPGPADGARPHHGRLRWIPSTGRLWGLTEAGGAHGRGVAFSIAPDGGDLRVHHSFGADAADAASPRGSLSPAGDVLFGLSSEGGRWGLGALFRIGTDGGGYEVLASFGGSDTGAHPADSVLVWGGSGTEMALYGTTSTGGGHDPGCERGMGTVFRYDLGRMLG